MFYWIYEIPTLALGTLFAATFVGATIVSIIITRPLVRRWGPFPDNYNEVVGNIAAGYSGLYGILLALIAVGAYQNLSDVDQMVSAEAASLGALFRDTSSYPEPIRTELLVAEREYCRFVIERGWPQYRRGIIPHEGTERVDDLKKRLIAFEPKTKGQEILHAEAIHQFNVFADIRRRRLHSMTSGLPSVLWYVVGIGALIGILLTCFFSFERLSFHLTISSLLWLFTGLVIFLIAAMDNPLRGEVSISADAFQSMLEALMNIQ